MDFHEQRARDMARAESRPRAFAIAHKTRGLLGRYVSSRRMPVSPGEPVTKILWGRIALAAIVLALAVLGVLRAVRS